MPKLKPVAVLLAASTALAAAPVLAQELIDSTNFRNAVTPGNIQRHLRTFQRIADRNGGTRASGTSGYAASVRYIVNQLPASAYAITRQVFPFSQFEELAPATLAQVSPNAVTYSLGTDFLTMEYSGSAPAGVTAPIEAVDVLLPPGSESSSSTSGCEASDFAGFTAGHIALIQRGTCDFAVKAANAEAAGAVGAIIFNEGQPGRTEALNGTLGGPGATIPVVGSTFELGNTLAALSDATIRVSTDTKTTTRNTENVLAETRGGRANRVVLVGAHLDSVPEGPGINDNGSGSATILEIARQLANIPVRNKVRFAFWGAEESGLLGSEYYVAQLRPAEARRIALNLNFDMLGSPNFVRFVYDGDASDSPDTDPGPDGSALIEQVFLQYFGFLGLPTEPTAFDGRSDYGPFIAVGIPAGGLFSGAEGIKTAREARRHGGTAGVAYDVCYHQDCDTIANISVQGLDQLSDGAAHAVLTFAQRRQPVASGTAAVTTAAGQRLAASGMDYKGHHLRR